MTQKIQENFSNIIRKQKKQTDKRLTVYQNLFFKNVQGFINNTFVVTQKFYNKKSWNEFIKNFILKYNSGSPYFKDISNEFYSFLKEEYQIPEYISELMDYELAELELFVKDSCINDKSTFDKSEKYKLSELAKLKIYSFPVHNLNGKIIPEKKETYIIVYRNDNNQVKFIEINEITFSIIEELKNQSTEEIISSNNLDNTFLLHAKNFITKFLDLGILIK